VAKLILSEFRCDAETNEVGDDSPYFVIFFGDPSNKLDPSVNKVKTIRKDMWDNETHTGKLWQPEMVVGGYVDPSRLVLVALMEEDNSCDLVGDALQQINEWMRPTFAAHAVQGKTLAALATEMIDEFEQAIEAYRTNDDLVQVLRLPIKSPSELNASGQLPLLWFNGDGGKYHVRFRVVE